MLKTAAKQQGINKDWFVQKLAEGNKSVRGLARHLEVDPSAVSRMLAGQRKMKMEEASEIARFLGASVSEVLSHAGVSIDVDGQPTQIVLAAIINEHGVVERLQSPTPLPQNLIDRAQAAITIHGNSKTIAAQIRAVGGPLAIFDDAVFLFAPTDTVDTAAIGVLSVCRSREGTQFVAKIERCRKTGEARVLNALGEVAEVSLVTASPILAVIP